MSETPLNMVEFTKKSEAFYQEIKADLNEQHKGKFAALDYETRSYWVGKSASEALILAKGEYPQKLFYLVQVGSPSTFSIQSMLPGDDLDNSHEYHWSY